MYIATEVSPPKYRKALCSAHKAHRVKHTNISVVAKKAVGMMLNEEKKHSAKYITSIANKIYIPISSLLATCLCYLCHIQV